MGPKSGTLAVNEWVCGYSSGKGIQNDRVLFYFGNNSERNNEISITNSDEFRLLIFKNTNVAGGSNSAFSDRAMVAAEFLEPSKRITETTDIAKITIETDGKVHSYANDEGYIFYMRLYDPS